MLVIQSPLVIHTNYSALASLVAAAGITAASAPANAAFLELEREYTNFPTLGHSEKIEVYTITVEKGDSLAKIVKQLNKSGLKHKSICGTVDASIEDLVRRNEHIRNALETDGKYILKPGEKLKYHRVAMTYPGFTFSF